MKHIKLLLFATAVCLLVVPAYGDIIILKNGNQLKGKVTETEEGFVIARNGSKVTIPKTLVDSVEYVDVEALEKEYAGRLETAGDDSRELIRLAEWCAKNDLGDRVEKLLRRVLELDPDNEKIRRHFGYTRVDDKWMTKDELMESKGFIKYKNRWVTPAEKEYFEKIARKEAESEKLTEEIKETLKAVSGADKEKSSAAIEKLRSMPEKERNAVLEQAINSRDWRTAGGAALVSAEFRGSAAQDDLTMCALIHPRRLARYCATEGLKALRRGEKINVGGPVIPYLNDSRGEVRIAAAEVLGFLQHAPALNDMRRNYRHVVTYGGGPRCHVYFGEQQAYIRDYDVQLAAFAAIADPIIDYVNSGVVLDTQVLWLKDVYMTLAGRVFHDAMEKIAGEKLPVHPDLLDRWWLKNKERFE